MSVFIGFGFNLKWQNELFLKPLSLVGRPNSLQHGRKQAEAFLGTQCWDPSIPSSLLCPAQLCVCYARRCFLSKLLSFHHFDGLSMSVDVGYVRTSLPLTAVIWPWKERKNVFGANAVGISATDAGRHMSPSSEAVWGSVGHSAEGCASLIFCFKYSSFYGVSEIKPNCQTEWNKVLWDNNDVRMPAVKFYPTRQGLHSWRRSGSEAYPADGWRSLPSNWNLEMTALGPFSSGQQKERQMWYCHISDMTGAGTLRWV